MPETKSASVIEKEWFSHGVHFKTAQKLGKDGSDISSLLVLDAKALDERLSGFSPAGQRSVKEVLAKVSALKDEPAVVVPEEVKKDPDPVPETIVEAGEGGVGEGESSTVEEKEPEKEVAKKPAKLKSSSGLKKAKEILMRLDKDSRALIEIASQSKRIHYERKSTGFTALDAVTGGGFPEGKFSVILGEERTCKTTLCLHTIAQEQKKNPDAIWIWDDAENSFDTGWAEKIGVDLDRLLMVPPLLLEDSVTCIEDMIRDGGVSGVVIDSISAWLPSQEVKKDKDDKEFTKTVHSDTMGLLARVIGKVFRRMNLPVSHHKISWVSITHVYVPIGTPFPVLQGKGGNALKHWCHLRLLTSRRKGAQNEKMPFQMPDGRIVELVPHYEAVFKVDKTRQGPTESQQVAIPFIFNRGLSEDDSVIDMAFAYGVVTNSGAWWTHPSFVDFDGAKAGRIQGRDNVVKAIKSSPELLNAISRDVGIALIQREGVPDKFISGETEEDVAVAAMEDADELE